MKKNKLLFPLALGILLTSCQKELEPKSEVLITEESTNSVAITDPNDPNNNRNWNFANPSQQTALIYHGQRIAGQPVQSTQVALPWFTAGNPINNTDQDYKPELGWVLYLKDFGTPQRPAQTPFFALYNKYSGVLRFFVYNYRVKNLAEGSKTYYVGELGFTSSNNFDRSISFFSDPDDFLTPNAQTKQIVLTKKNASDTWLNFDFVMTKDGLNNQYTLNIYGANEAELNFGIDFSTLTSKSSVGATSQSVSGFGSAINRGYEYVSNVQSLFDAIDKARTTLNGSGGNESKSAAASIITNTQLSPSQINTAPQRSVIGAISAVIGVVKGVLSLVKSFTGGKNSISNTQTVIQYSGIAQSTGTSTLTNNLYSLQYTQQAGSQLNASRYVPMYNGRIGVMTIPASAEFSIQRSEHTACREVGQPYSTMNKTIYRMKTNWTNDFFSIDTIPGLLVDSVTVALVSRKAVDSTQENFLIGMGNHSRASWRDPSYAYHARERSEFLTQDSTQSHWKVLRTANLDRNLTLATLYYAATRNAGPESFMPRPSYTDKSFPLVAVGIYYRVTDANYPKEESRERVIYKVFRSNTTTMTHNLINTYGCPL